MLAYDSLDLETIKRQMPPAWKIDQEEYVNRLMPVRGHKIVVLDDDPTGTQTVADIRVVTSWDLKTLCRNLEADAPAFYILTNSRSLSPDKARDLALELGELLATAAQKAQVKLTVISRGDSTLRGHFPDEVFALQRGLQQGGYTNTHGVLLVPAFFEGGRYTLDNTHWVRINDRLVPVGETEFAQDPAFGFRSSKLPDWVEEKTDGAIKKESVRCVDLQTIRGQGPTGVIDHLRGLGMGDVAIVNAIEYADLEVVAAAYWALHREGEELLVRSAASFVPVLSGIKPGRSITGASIDWTEQTENGGLVIVGSHVDLTNQQLEILLEKPSSTGIEISVKELQADHERQVQELSRVREETERQLLAGKTAVVYTSRDVLVGDDAEEYLNIGQRISDGLSELVAELSVRPSFIVAKGGITSSDTATRGLSCQEAMVIGQVLPGVAVWHMGDESKFPGIPYVVFPGNVGQPTDLAHVVSDFTKSVQASRG